MEKDINDLIKEISKRDRVITNLLTSAIIKKMIRYGSHKSSVEECLEMLSFETYDLDQFCENARDQAVSFTLNHLEHAEGSTPIEKARIMSEKLSKLLDGEYERNLKNELRIAVDQKRIQLMKEFG